MPRQVIGEIGLTRENETRWIDAPLSGLPPEIAWSVEPVLEQAGMNGVRIVSLLGTHLVGMAVARAERDRGTVFRHLVAARPYGLRNYKEEAAHWCEWSAYWTAAELSGALRAALAADTALKTATVSDDRGIVTQLVLGFAAPNREAA